MATYRVRLSDDEGGRWQVTTGTAVYLLDLDRRTVLRAPDSGGGREIEPSSGSQNPVVHLADDHQPLSLFRLMRCELGRPLMFKTRSECEPGARPRTATEIRQIREVLAPRRDHGHG